MKNPHFPDAGPRILGAVQLLEEFHPKMRRLGGTSVSTHGEE